MNIVSTSLFRWYYSTTELCPLINTGFIQIARQTIGKRTNKGGERIETLFATFSKFSVSIREQFVNDWRFANLSVQLLATMFGMVKSSILL